jgi:hypothetical protein
MPESHISQRTLEILPGNAIASDGERGKQGITGRRGDLGCVEKWRVRVDLHPGACSWAALGGKGLPLDRAEMNFAFLEDGESFMAIAI